MSNHDPYSDRQTCRQVACLLGTSGREQLLGHGRQLFTTSPAYGESVELNYTYCQRQSSLPSGSLKYESSPPGSSFTGVVATPLAFNSRVA